MITVTICAWCPGFREQQIAAKITRALRQEFAASNPPVAATVSHGMCPACAAKFEAGISA
jgi:hypothetical protein